MKRALSTLIVSLATTTALICAATPAHAATVSEDFSSGLGNWTMFGGGQLYTTPSGQLSAVGTPSVPVSWAFHTTPATGPTQEVSATIAWNGRTPQHSAMSVALRADPATQHAGVHFWFTATLMGIAMLNWNGTTFTPATGTPAYNQILRKWPDGARITLKASGNTYAAYVSTTPWMPILWGTFTSTQVPHTNMYGGVHGQDDSAVPNGGQPPANLDNWTFSPVAATGVSAQIPPMLRQVSDR